MQKKLIPQEIHDYALERWAWNERTGRYALRSCERECSASLMSRASRCSTSSSISIRCKLQSCMQILSCANMHARICHLTAPKPQT